MIEIRDNQNLRFQRLRQNAVVLTAGLILLVYAAAHLILALTGSSVSVYEVTEGTLQSNHHFRALALRQETVCYAQRSGQIYYYSANGTRAGVKTLIYSLDETGEINTLLKNGSDHQELLSREEKRSLSSMLSAFVNEYDDESFSHTYPFKANLSGSLAASYSARAISAYADEIYTATNANTFHLYYASEPGMVSYHLDGLEGVNASNFTPESFDGSLYTETDLKNLGTVKAGEPVYKMILSDDWQVLMEIDNELAEALAGSTYVQVRFDEDGNTAWGQTEIFESRNKTYLLLSFDDSMERYMDLRYLSLELLTGEQSGLKIPNSAIVQKSFYSVPKDLFMLGGNEGAEGLGLMIRRGGNDLFVQPERYYETDEAYYVDNELLEEEDLVLWPGRTDTYRLNSVKETLPGVYSLNRGYAKFRLIDILYQNEDYAIVAKGTSYGIALYDHIALESRKVRENEVIR